MSDRDDERHDAHAEHAGHDEHSSHDEHAGHRQDIGAYALGHLSRTENRRVRRHLAGCAECRAELAEITPIAQQLVRLRPSGAEAGAAESSRTAARPPARRVALGAAAVLAVLAVGVLGGRSLAPEAPEPSTVAVEQVALRSTPAAQGATALDAGLIDHTWGVELRMTGTGFAEGEVYAVRFLGVDGVWAPAGRFVGTGDAELDCGMQSGVLRRDAVALQVLDASARPVLVAEL